jgi:hypothetical protein
MRFKQYFEAKLSGEALFGQRDITQKSNVGKLLGFINPLVKFSQGSMATLYEHPADARLLIKVTSHEDDVKNLAKAQKINSPNVVKLFPWKNKKLIKELPSLNSYAIIVEKIVGDSMLYTSSEFIELSLNGSFDLAADWLDGNLHKKQIVVLDRHNKNDIKEHYKLSGLFRSLHKLESFYGIELSDFQDNILDTVDRYVIVDMGY